MQKFGGENLVPLNLELERTLRKIRKDKKEAIEFGDKSMNNLDRFREEEEVVSRSGESVSPHTPPMDNFLRELKDYALPPIGIPPVIRRPTIQEINF